MCRVSERVKEKDPMLNAPKKHKVLRIYRIDEGREGAPIDVDEAEAPESEAEVESLEEDVLHIKDDLERPRKRRKTLDDPNLDIL